MSCAIRDTQPDCYYVRHSDSRLANSMPSPQPATPYPPARLERLRVPQPEPSAMSPARIVVSYEHDVAGGAEVLLAVLRETARLDGPVRDGDRDERDVG